MPGSSQIAERTKTEVIGPALDDDKDTIPLEIVEHPYSRKRGRKGLKLS